VLSGILSFWPIWRLLSEIPGFCFLISSFGISNVDAIMSKLSPARTVHVWLSAAAEVRAARTQQIKATNKDILFMTTSFLTDKHVRVSGAQEKDNRRV
jgi:uncharacterized ubiquitin-like protein YukD